MVLLTKKTALALTSQGAIALFWNEHVLMLVMASLRRYRSYIAAGSDAGITFAGRHSDIVFITSPAGGDIESALSSLPAHTKRVKQSAIANGRQVRTLLNPLIVVRETEKEAQEYAQAIIDHADYSLLIGHYTKPGLLKNN